MYSHETWRLVLADVRGHDDTQDRIAATRNYCREISQKGLSTVSGGVCVLTFMAILRGLKPGNMLWHAVCHFIVSARAPGATPAPTVRIAEGIDMPLVALGTGEYQEDKAMHAVFQAISLGYRAIDTAHQYGNQVAVGEGVRAALANTSLNLTRKDLFVITKVEGGLTANETAVHLAEDVARLGIGPKLDLVLLHYPKARPPLSLTETIAEQWGAISEFVVEGRARAAGVSQFCDAAFVALDSSGATTRPIVNQVGWHVGQGPDPQGVQSTALARNDLTVMAFSPLDEANANILHGEPYTTIASSHSSTPAQVALRWLAQRRIPLAVAATSPQYQLDNLDIFGFELSAAEMERIDHATQPSGCPFWPGSVCWQMSGCNHTCCDVNPTFCPPSLPPCLQV